MENLQFSAYFLAVLAAIAVGLSIVSGVRRGKAGVQLGDGGDVKLLAAMRAQANFMEVTPLTFLLIAALEASALASWAVLALGGTLVAARLIHAFGFLGNDGGSGMGRTIGAAGTTLVTVIALITLVVMHS